MAKIFFDLRFVEGGDFVVVVVVVVVGGGGEFG